MIKYINQAITLQASISRLNSFESCVTLKTYLDLARSYEKSENRKFPGRSRTASSYSASSEISVKKPHEHNKICSCGCYTTDIKRKIMDVYIANSDIQIANSSNDHMSRRLSQLQVKIKENKNLQRGIRQRKIMLVETPIEINVPMKLYSVKKDSRNYPPIPLEKYGGKSLSSASGPLTIIGTVNVKNCIIDPNAPLKNQVIKVAALNTINDCLLGLDIDFQDDQKLEAADDLFCNLTKICHTFDPPSHTSQGKFRALVVQPSELQDENKSDDEMDDSFEMYLDDDDDENDDESMEEITTN
ncbi:hypothetical protein BpHYR1_027682, partial [Brachionus plicatilis]